MPFGLCNATASFQRLMIIVLKDIPQTPGNLVLCYVEDILIATTTVEQHLEKLDMVFKRIAEAGLKCKPSKCNLMQTKATFLGRIIGEGEVKPNPEMYETLKKWEEPKTKKQLQSLLGFVNYYREFIKDLSEKVHVLKELTNPNREFTWEEEHAKCFEVVRDSLIEAPLLHQPEEEGEYVLDIDASEVAIAGILSQRRVIDGEEKECPIVFGSKALSETEMRYPAAKAEKLAALYFIEKYRPYLTRAKFTLSTDNSALSWLKRYSMTRGMAARWIQRLDQYNFDVIHRPREKPQNADGLLKKSEFYTKKQIKGERLPAHMSNFTFLADPEQFDKLPELTNEEAAVEIDLVHKHSRQPAHCTWEVEKPDSGDPID